jgi:7-cyano-7-deazaguanine synthase
MLGMAQAMKAGTYAQIELLRPFINDDKAGIAKRGMDLGIDFAKTWSCYKGGDIHCGVCGTCVERREAFMMAGVSDPTVYEQTPPIPKAPAAY